MRPARRGTLVLLLLAGISLFFLLAGRGEPPAGLPEPARFGGG